MKAREVRFKAPWLADKLLKQIVSSLRYRLCVASVTDEANAARSGTARRLGNEGIADLPTEGLKRRPIAGFAWQEAFSERQRMLTREQPRLPLV
jgi:hypothetical protein